MKNKCRPLGKLSFIIQWHIWKTNAGPLEGYVLLFNDTIIWKTNAGPLEGYVLLFNDTSYEKQMQAPWKVKFYYSMTHMKNKCRPLGRLRFII